MGQFKIFEKKCTICGGSEDKAHIVSVFNPLTNSDLDFFRCQSCESIFPDPFEFPEYYVDEAKQNYVRFYAEVGAGLDLVVRLISVFKSGKKLTMLDVGCGFGYTVDYAKRVLGWDAFGIEPGTYGRIGAAALDVEIDNALLGAGSKFDNQQFDVVFNSEVLEHVENPNDFLKLLYRSVRDGGVLVLTTPAAEYVVQENWQEQVLDTLSPGYHTNLFSESALNSSLHAAGFTDIKTIRWSDRIIALAGRNRELDQFDILDRRQKDYLEYLTVLESSDIELFVRNGAAFRLFKELVNAGNYNFAEEIWKKLNSRLIKKFGAEVLSKNWINNISKSAVDFEIYGQSAPYFLAPLLFYRGIQILNTAQNFHEAIEKFQCAEIMSLAESKFAQAYFIESASLLWLIRYHLGLSLLLNKQREEALLAFNRIIGSYFEEAGTKRALLAPFIVSRAIKDSGVCFLQMGKKADARERFLMGLARTEEKENKGLHSELINLLEIVDRDLSPNISTVQNGIIKKMFGKIRLRP